MSYRSSYSPTTTSSSPFTPTTPPPGPKSPPTTAAIKPNRLPAPTLFVGPPNLSQTSVSKQGLEAPAAGGNKIRDPGNRQRSALGRGVADEGEEKEKGKGGGGLKDGGGLESGGGAGAGVGVGVGKTTMTKSSEKEVEAKWREMQRTLTEVELTAQSSTHVFSASHAEALDELRRAQVELARAWGRRNEGKVAEEEEEEGRGLVGGEVGRFKAADEIAEERRRNLLRSKGRGGDGGSVASTVLSDEEEMMSRSNASREGGSGVGGGAGVAMAETRTLEDETALDIRRASERRAANEAYFRKVDAGVKEVVRKLEGVAEAMRGVEAENRSLWSESSRGSGDGEGEEEKRERERRATVVRAG